MRELFPEKMCGMALKKGKMDRVNAAFLCCQAVEKKIPIFYDLCYTNSINLKLYRGIAMEQTNRNRSDIHGIER